MRPCFWWDRGRLRDKDGRLLAQRPCAAWWSPAPATGKEPPGHKQAIEWDTRRLKAAKRSLGLILEECCIHAWESQPCLSPEATQVLGSWKWWDFIAHMEEVWVLLQKSPGRAMMPTEQLSAGRPPRSAPAHPRPRAWAISWKKSRCLSLQTCASRQDSKARENYLWEVILPWIGSAPSFAARFKNLSAKDRFTLASEELKINYVHSEKL